MEEIEIQENITDRIIFKTEFVEVNKILQFEEQERLRPIHEARALAEKKEQDRVAHNARIEAQYNHVSGGYRYDWGRHNRELHTHGFRKGY
jgi:hypothetical protein